MNSYKCTKESCGETMISKNPATRHIFPEDGMASIMTNIVNVRTVKGARGERIVTFEFPHTDTRAMSECPDDYLEMSCANMIRTLTEEQLTHWLCDHEWELTDEVTPESEYA